MTILLSDKVDFKAETNSVNLPRRTRHPKRICTKEQRLKLKVHETKSVKPERINKKNAEL